MILLGTIVNVIAIIVGSSLGLIFTKIEDKYKETIMQGIALTVIIIGIQMAFTSESIIIVLLSILTGAFIGEVLKLDDLLNKLGFWIAARVTTKDTNTNVAQGFITASLLFVVGAMAILGSLDSGIRGDHEILFTKSILDGFTSLVLTTTLGIGVILSIIPVLLFQGTITLLAAKIDHLISDTILNSVILEMTAVGGILILAIGLNLLKLTQIRVMNLLPSLVTVIIFVYILQMF